MKALVIENISTVLCMIWSVPSNLILLDCNCREKAYGIYLNANALADPYNLGIYSHLL